MFGSWGKKRANASSNCAALGSFACPRDGKNNVISQNETLRRRDHPIDVGGCTARGQREALGPCCNDPGVQIANIDESVINVALPAIETDLATSIVTI